MAKLRIPRGLYLTSRIRGDSEIVFRWGMAPGLRKRGIKAIDLVDQAGKPLALKAAIARAGELTLALKSGAPAPTLRSSPGRTVGDLLDAYLGSANLDHMTAIATDRPLADATKASYKKWSVGLEDVFRDEPIGNLTPELIAEWYTTTRQVRGHTMAHCGYRLLRIVLGWKSKAWGVPDIDWKECVRLGRISAPPAKLRVGRPDELACLLIAMDNPAELYARLEAEGTIIPAADRIPARPELGDSLVLAIWTAQRVKDVLAITDDALAADRLRWVSSKRTRGIDMPLLGPLPKRVAAARERRKARGANVPNFVLHPERPGAYSYEMHGRHFREARALAGRFFPSLLGVGVDLWGRPIKPFTFEDCRDTGITRLHDAGCDLLEICSWSNHKSPRSLMQVIEAYIEISGKTADRAGDKMTAWWASAGMAV